MKRLPRVARALYAGLAISALVLGAAIACSHSSGSPAPRPSARTPAAVQPGIFTLLPFSQQQLDTAYTSAGHAGAAYQTFTYTDTPASYGGRIAPWVSPSYLTYLEQTFGNTSTTAARARLHEHSSATSDVLSIRTFGPTSITFIVQITQNDPVTDDSGNYAITAATTDGKAWQVSDIEPAAAGN